MLRAQLLRQETAVDSISPERAGSIMYDTLAYINQMQLQAANPLLISKIYASVAAMEADSAPVSDLTGQPLRPGQVVVIASADSDNGSVYRYNGGTESRWTVVGKIGNLTPVDSLGSDSTQLPLAARQGKVLDEKVSALGQEIFAAIGDIDTEIAGAAQFPIDETSLGSIGNNTTSIFMIIPEKRITKVNRIRFVGRTGTIYFYKVKWDGTNAATFSLITSRVINPIENTAILEINVDVDLASDEYIGVNGNFWFKNNTSGYNGGGRVVTMSTGAVSGFAAGQYLFTNPYYKDLDVRVLDVTDYAENTERMAVMYDGNFSTTNPDFVGPQTISGGKLVVGTDTIYLDKFYSLAHRTFRALCTFNSTVKAVFSTVDYNNNVETGYCNRIIIDMSAKTVQCLAQGAVYCSLLNLPGHPFLVEITKHYQRNIVKITDIYNGASWSHTWTFSGRGGTGEGEVSPLVNTGMAWDKYAMRTTSGIFQVERVTVLGEKTDVIFYGDSITEPEGYWPTDRFDHAWTQLLRRRSRGRIIFSGRGGSGLNTMLPRMQAELPALMPKAVFVTIGTNGGISYATMKAVVDYIKSLGITPYINHIPANLRGTVSNHAEVNAIIDQLRADEQITGIDFDLPTSVSYLGVNVNTATMWHDQQGDVDVYLHPNELGSAAMVARVLIDVPEIFNI